MNYTEFSSLFMVAAYLESKQQGGGRVRSGDILIKYDLSFSPTWVHTCISDWGVRGWIRGKGVVGDENSQPISFTGLGLEYAERLLLRGNMPELRRPIDNVPSASNALEAESTISTTISKSSEETSAISLRLQDAISKIDELNLSQQESSQAKAYLAASLAIAESPSPHWELIKEILMVISVIAGVGSLVAGILALI